MNDTVESRIGRTLDEIAADESMTPEQRAFLVETRMRYETVNTQYMQKLTEGFNLVPGSAKWNKVMIEFRALFNERRQLLDMLLGDLSDLEAK